MQHLKKSRKKSIGPFVLVSAGLLMIVLTFLSRFVAAPYLIKVPDNYEFTLDLAGSVTLFIDPETMKMLNENERIVIPFDLEVRATVIPEKSNKDVSLVKVEFLSRAPSKELLNRYGEIYETIKVKDQFFAVDRRTGMNVAGNNSDVDREGFNINLEIGTEKMDYSIWDIDYGKTVTLEYLREEKLDGNKYKDIPVFVFEEKHEPDSTVAAPAGLPDEIPVSDALSMLPATTSSSNIDPDSRIPIDYLKSIDAVVKYEPKTGFNLETVKHTEEFFINTEKYGIKPNPKIFELDYSTPESAITDAVDEAAGRYWILDLINIWIPLGILIAGVFLLAAGIFLLLHRHKYSQEQEPQSPSIQV